MSMKQLFLKYIGEVNSEFSLQFLQGMIDRMTVSYYKYGKVADAFPRKINALDTLQRCLDKYADTGNKEYLIDAANYCMIEFMKPRIEGAHYTPTDSHASTGRVWHGEVNTVHDKNVPDKEHE